MAGSLLYRLRKTPAAWRRRIVFWWLARDRGGFAPVAMLGLPVLALGTIVAFAHAGRSRIEAGRLHAERARAAELRCLAENVYFEARGEPLEGQYAIAEVTLNRVRSPHYPKTICGVVHDTRWDPIRRRLVAHFSWTELKDRSDPWGPAWQQATAVAAAAYDESHMPLVHGALHYHATSVQPYWARRKQSVARIGNHVFYR